MRIRFLHTAQYELDEAYNYYEKQQEGLGPEFLDDIFDVLRRVKAQPEAWPPFSHHTRRCLTSRFSYAVIYQILTDEILIIAVAQTHQKPEYWKDRLK